MKMYGDIAERYRDFAAHARTDSPCFEEWALGVCEDPEVQAWLADLPRIKQQPNLVFAAARWHGAAAPAPYAELRRVLFEGETEVRRTIASRSTQTNEVGRLATLVPVMARAGRGEKVCLVEAGSSAGLCLFPDRYDYAWPPLGGLTGSGGPTLRADAEGPVPIPERALSVAQRIGIDLHPLDVYDDDAVAWLANLVWPGQDDRLERLRQAVAIARAEPPDLRRGDLLEELPKLVAEAGRWGTPVVFHSAVVAYLDREDRARFHELMTGLVADGDCHWVSNEAPGALPEVSATGPQMPADLQRFVLGLDGHAVAWTHSHGRAIRWL